MTKLKSWTMGAALALAMAFAAAAAEPTAEKRAEAEAFAVNNAIATLYHEFGHLFVDQFELPVLGREEDVADTIATLMLMAEQSNAAIQVSLDTVDGYLMSSELYGEDLPENVDFGDEHGLDAQRAYQMTCLLVGGDPDDFGDLAADVGLDAERQEFCVEDYEGAVESWQRLTDGHRRLEPTGGAAIEVIYEDGGKKYEAMVDLLKRERVLERVVKTVADQFILLRPATLRGTLCGEENAYYDEEIGEIWICYEYVQLFYDLIVDPENAGMDLAQN